MNFGEKLRKLRSEHNMKQEDLAQLLNISVRSLSNYENGLRFPKHRETYEKLAKIFHVDYNFLLDEHSSFVTQAYQEYGEKGKDEAFSLLGDLTALFAGGKLSEDDRDEIMRLMQQAYWQSKEKAKEKEKQYQK